MVIIKILNTFYKIQSEQNLEYHKSIRTNVNYFFFNNNKTHIIENQIIISSLINIIISSDVIKLNFWRIV